MIGIEILTKFCPGFHPWKQLALRSFPKLSLSLCIIRTDIKVLHTLNFLLFYYSTSIPRCDPAEGWGDATRFEFPNPCGELSRMAGKLGESSVLYQLGLPQG